LHSTVSCLCFAAIFGYSFCRGGQQAFKHLASNALRVAAINSVGDFVLFLGKALVVVATILIGIKMFDVGYQHYICVHTLFNPFPHLKQKKYISCCSSHIKS
jgi:hypothetical protein